MVALASALVALASWILLRWWAARSGPTGAAAGWRHGRRDVQWLVVLAVVLATQVPLLRTVSPLLVADAAGHAAIAAALAEHGAPHGWIDVFNGGFPLGPHYPCVGWLLAALCIRCGAPAALAVSWIATIATVLVPVIVIAGARAAGARPIAGLAGALVLGCAAPVSPFVGGWGSYLEEGLYSQALAMPFAVGFLAALAAAPETALPPLLAALATATHPQIATATFFAGGVTAIVTGDGRVRRALLRSAIAAVAMGAAVFGAGIVTLRAPFGWPPMVEWKRIGFPAALVLRWLGDGNLLDGGRAPILTVAWAVALVVAVARRRSPACRVVLLGTAAAVLGALSGGMLEALGKAGAVVLSLYQPLRAVAVLPFAAAATILVAVEELASVSRGLVDARGIAPRHGRWLALVPWGIVALAAAPAILDRAEYGAEVRATFASWTRADWCTGPRPAGYATNVVEGWLASLPRGRFTITKGEPFENCPATHGVELASPTPMGRPIGAGAHVGVNHVAYRQLRLPEPGSDRRAESLGIRSVLHTRDQRPPPGSAWRVVAESGDTMLSVREGGTDFIGVGCVDAEASGPDPVLHDALIGDLEHGASVIKDPQKLLRIVWTSEGGLHLTPVAKGECDATGAVVEETPREPGAYEATIRLPHPADVVVRASAFPTWDVRVDGERAPVFVVAPGFVATRVAAGEHHVVATVSPPRGYVAGLVAALLVVLACAGLRGPRRRTPFGRRRT